MAKGASEAEGEGGGPLESAARSPSHGDAEKGVAETESARRRGGRGTRATKRNPMTLTATEVLATRALAAT